MKRKPRVPRNIKKLLDVDSLKRKLRNLRAKRSQYIAHANKEQYRDEVRDLKVRIKTSPQTRHKATAYDPAPKKRQNKTSHGISLGLYDLTDDQKAKVQYINHHIAILKRKIQNTKRKDFKLKWEKEIERIEKIRDDTSQQMRKYDIPPRWKEAMVKGIKNKSDVRNPWAIVNNIWAKLTPAKKAQIRAREKKGEHFKYDLPLPDDRATKGTGTLRMVKPFNLGEVQVNLSQKDYHDVLKSGLFDKMKRQDGTVALVKRCKSEAGNCNIFVDVT